MEEQDQRQWAPVRTQGDRLRSAAFRLRRSVLYVPGSHARALDKSRQLAADALVLDLEDAVAPSVKHDARERVCEAVRLGGFGGKEVIVRINALDSPWGEEDLSSVASAAPDAILLPKVASDDTVAQADRVLDQLAVPPSVGLWAMVENPHALLGADMLLRSATRRHSRLACLVMGLNDLSLETRARQIPGRAPMLPWLAHAVLVARAYGLCIVDGVFNDLADTTGLAAECGQARDLGFDGKSLIHPDQIPAANSAFSPSKPELARARAIVAAFADPANAQLGAIRMGREMVERLHLREAEQVLAAGAASGLGAAEPIAPLK